MEAYAEASGRVMGILESLSPLVEPLSIDEAFVELTGTERLHGPAPEVARALKDRVRTETGLTASVGVAPNKFLAKIASDLGKPDGLAILEGDGVDRVLLPLRVERLWGVGPRTAAALHDAGVRTIGDLREWSEERLRARFGGAGEHFWRLARALDDRPVVPDHEARQIGQECTFEQDLEDPEDARAFLRAHADEVARRLRRRGIRARGVQVKIRYGKFETVTRSETLPEAVDTTADLRDAALRIFARWAAGGYRPVRLVGVCARDLETGPAAPFLFPDDERARRRRLDGALDEISGRFGRGALRRGPPPAPAGGPGVP
jgi:DNA polymerase-4